MTTTYSVCMRLPLYGSYTFVHIDTMYNCNSPAGIYPNIIEPY